MKVVHLRNDDFGATRSNKPTDLVTRPPTHQVFDPRNDGLWNKNDGFYT